MSIFHTSLSFIRHNYLAKTRHGTHSPFVYSLLENVVYAEEKDTIYEEIELHRKHLLTDERTITITDLGAGSHVNAQKSRNVKDIARHSLKSQKYARLLYRLAAYFKPSSMIELGTSLGITSLYLAKACPDATLHTIEGCPQTSAVAAELFSRSGVSNINVQQGNFDDVLPHTLKMAGRADFVYFDGNHRKEATLNYFRQCLPYTSEKSVWVFDDIYWSGGMTEAWKEIKAHPEVSVTIDLFTIGLVFFHKGQAKQDFRIRY